MYEADAEEAIAAEVGFQFAPDLFDLDPYGSPWPVFDAIVGQSAKWSRGPVGFAVNDGLRQKLKPGGGWHVGAMREAVAEFGNHRMTAWAMGPRAGS